ncbi:MAG: MurR/RpiR family transcriptional regulator [Lawsonibacter sp.]|nr:MurR/RpiR family transcriptional regulator [Lawsonibacter sp.]
MDGLIAKIQTMSLTRTDASIAEYILEHIDTIGLQTSTALAEAIGVSDTSIIRFIRKLGFKGYADFRNEMAGRMAKQCDQSRQAASLLSGEKYALTKDRLKKDSLIRDISDCTLDNLEKSFSKLDNETVDQVVDILLKSRRRFVAGFRGTASCAQYMSNRLVLLLPNIVPILHADSSAIEALVDIEADDCLFLYSFMRYSEINYCLLDIARRKGAKVILMTDSYTSPLASKSDIVLVAKVTGLGFTNSYVAPLSISEVILLTISDRKDSKCAERLRMMDEIIQQSKLY